MQDATATLTRLADSAVKNHKNTMSNYQFFNGQAVKVTVSHNHFTASAGTIYHVGSTDRVMGINTVQLLQDGKAVGAIPESKLFLAK